jgi:hypothetical protein
MTKSVWGQRPPAAAPAVEGPTTTYAEMLGKGYAAYGQIRCRNYTAGCSEGSVKRDLLKESGQCGADFAWLAVTRGSYSVGSMSEARTYTSYSSSSMGYMGSSGTPASTTTTTYRPTFHTKEYPYINGTATLFVHDPALAAKQLKEGRERWEARAKAIQETRPVLIAKLMRIEETVGAYDVSLFISPAAKASMCDAAKNARYILQVGKYYDPEFAVYNRTTSASVCDLLEKAGPEAVKYSSVESRPEPFKDPSVKERKEIRDLVEDAFVYCRHNEAALFDYDTLAMPEHILF